MENLFSSSVFNQLLMSEIMLQLHDFSLTFFFFHFHFFSTSTHNENWHFGANEKSKKFNFKQFFLSFMKHNYTSKKKKNERFFRDGKRLIGVIERKYLAVDDERKRKNEHTKKKEYKYSKVLCKTRRIIMPLPLEIKENFNIY